jgi:hypothetical protein
MSEAPAKGALAACRPQLSLQLQLSWFAVIAAIALQERATISVIAASVATTYPPKLEERTWK